MSSGVLSATHHLNAGQGHANGVILAHQHGRRPDTVCEQLFNKVEMFPVKTMYTNAWQSNANCIPAEKPCIGKKNSWKIERTHLNFRTHLKRLPRKTMCFSRNEEIHDTVRGLYREREYYRNTYLVQTA
ncbi:MAG: hypothetical protein GY801_42485 [bacterium]|nr:hypothetical protein [bacterium]